jgi:DNA sulfur modification protein DndB
MLENIFSREELVGLARKRRLSDVKKTVPNKMIDEAIDEGWTIEKRGKKTTCVKKEKAHNVLLEDKVWSLLYKMGFHKLSGKEGAFVVINPSDSTSPKTQIDVVGIDHEVALAIECKSCATPLKRPKFQEELTKIASYREKFATYINRQFPEEKKRHSVLAMFTSNAILTEPDKKRAEDLNIYLFDEKDLEYYEDLTSHLGPASRYQFLADILPGKSIEGLSIKIPAIKSRIGGFNAYSFSISPDYLLKLSYIAHRAKGKIADVSTYQRMIKKSRLKKIRDYISEGGVFPTNIVINLEKSRKLSFEKAKQESENKNSVLGWLTLAPAYKSAWVIDGQHRLFAYSGHERAERSLLSVLAFEGLPSSKQAQLFVDINSEQKSVKSNLLRELYAELRWDSEDLETRVSAIISKAVQDIDKEEHNTPFYGRILLSDEKKTDTRCITLESMARALEKAGFFIRKIKKDINEPGPLWAGNNDDTLKRTKYIVNGWFNIIKDKATDWWNLGKSEGGGLAMNDGVTICINVLRSVFNDLEDSKKIKLVQLDDSELLKCISPYGEILGSYLSGLSEENRRTFRRLRGGQGQNTGTKRCETAIHEQKPDFLPPGLSKFIESEKRGTNKKAKEVIDNIELMMQKTIIEELKDNFEEGERQWWFSGVPKSIRMKVTARYEEDDGHRGAEECYFDLIEYRTIITENWDIFEELFAYGDQGNKDKRTAWIVEVNNIRKVVMHASSGVNIESEQLRQLEEYEEWLKRKIEGTV